MKVAGTCFQNMTADKEQNKSRLRLVTESAKIPANEHVVWVHPKPDEVAVLQPFQFDRTMEICGISKLVGHSMPALYLPQRIVTGGA